MGIMWEKDTQCGPMNGWDGLNPSEIWKNNKEKTAIGTECRGEGVPVMVEAKDKRKVGQAMLALSLGTLEARFPYPMPDSSEAPKSFHWVCVCVCGNPAH